jgi:hypothetical protein
MLMCSVDVPPPWLARVAHIKAAAQSNVDTERKVVRLSEELKDMLREIKLRVSVAMAIGDWRLVPGHPLARGIA